VERIKNFKGRIGECQKWQISLHELKANVAIQCSSSKAEAKQEANSGEEKLEHYRGVETTSIQTGGIIPRRQ
jgi:hypothetical protein